MRRIRPPSSSGRTSDPTTSPRWSDGSDAVGVYRLQIKTSAAKELDSISLDGDRRRVAARIRALADDPRPPGCQKLGGGPDRYRIRQGRFRVIYSIDDRVRVVVVFRIGDRRSVYR